MKDRRQWLLLLAAVAVAFGVVCRPLVQGRIYAGLDHEAFSVPLRVAWSVAMERGEWGHWNPYLWRGFTVLGKGEIGTLHPVQRLAFKWLPMAPAVALWQVCFLPLALVGAWLFLRRPWRLDPAAALFGAALYAGCVWYTAHFGMTHMCIILAHTPWVCWAVDGTWGRRCWLAAAALGLLYGSMFLLGHPQMVFFVSAAAGLLMLWRGLERRWDQRWRLGIGRAAIGIAAGLLIGMLQLLPTLATLRANPRGHLTEIERANYGTHPAHLLQNLSPFLLNDPAGGPLGYILGDEIGVPGGGRVYLHNPSSGAAYFGVGLLVFVFAGAVLLRREWLAPERRLRTGAVAALLAILVLLMLGRYGGLNRLVGYLPLVRLFSSPNRYKCLVALLLAVLAAVVYARLARGDLPAPTRRDWLLLAIPPVLIALVTGVILARGGIDHVGRQIPAVGGRAAAYGLLVALLVLGGVTAVRRGRRWVLPLVAVLCFWDLCLFGLPIVRTVPYKSVAEVNAMRDAVRDPAPHPYRVHIVGPTHGNVPMWHGRYMTTGFLGTMRPVVPLDHSKDAHLRLAAVQTVIDSDRQEVRQLADPLPRARLVPNIERGGLDRLTEIDPATTALTTANRQLTGPPLADTESVHWVTDSFDRVVLDVRVSQPRLLVLADRWDPNWYADVDGAPRPILPLYGRSSRGVEVFPGDRQVALVYRPGTWRRGWTSVALGLFVVLCLAAVDFRQRQREHRT